MKTLMSFKSINISLALTFNEDEFSYAIVTKVKNRSKSSIVYTTHDYFVAYDEFDKRVNLLLHGFDNIYPSL